MVFELRASCAWLALAGLLSACTPAQQQPVVSTVLDTRERRDTSFEATLRELDQHPEYVDELFEHARQHPKTLQRLLHVTAAHLTDRELARLTAAELIGAPAGLEVTLEESLTAMQQSPPAMNAAAAAIEARPQPTAHMLVQRDQAVVNMLHALTQEVRNNPAAARAFRTGIKENSDVLASIIMQEPELTVTLFKSVAKSGLKHGEHEFQAFLRAYSE